MKGAAFDRLLASVYRCPGDPDAWTELARQMAHGFGSAHVQLLLFRADGRVCFDAADEPDAGREYTLGYASRDLAAPKVMSSAPSQALWSHALLSRAELDRCPVQNELLPRMGIGSRTWVHAPCGSDLVFSTGILHGPAGGGLDDRGSRLLVRLHGHLQQAMQLHLTLEAARAQQQSLSTGLDALGTGVVLLEQDGGVIFANRAARRVFEDGHLRLIDGRLGAPSSADDAALRRLIFVALRRNGHAGTGAVDLAGLRVQAVPMGEPNNSFHRGVGAVLLVSRLASPNTEPAQLAALGLTPAEVALAAALGEGESLEKYAARTGRSLGTVRAQLRSVFGKTDTHRQSELVLLVTRILAGLRSEL